MSPHTRTRYHFKMAFHVDHNHNVAITPGEKLAAAKAIIADPGKFDGATSLVSQEEVEYKTFLVAIQINAPFPVLVTVPVVAYDHQAAELLALKKAYPDSIQYVREITSVPRETYELFSLLWEANKP